MTAADPRPRRKHRRRTRRPLLILITVFAIFVVLVAAVARRGQTRDLENHLNAIREKGEPITIEELAAWHPEPPENENAARKLLEIMDGYPKTEGIDTSSVAPNRRPLSWEPIDEEQRNTLSALMDANRECLARLHDALQAGHAKYPASEELHANSGFPYENRVGDAVWLYKLAVLHYVDARDWDSTVSCIVDLMRIAHTLKHEPYLAAQLFRSSIHDGAFQAVERLLNATELSPEHLQSLTQAFRDERDADWLYRGLVGHRCLYFNDLRTGTGAAERSPIAAAASTAPYLAFGIQYVDAARLDSVTRAARMREIEAGIWRSIRGPKELLLYPVGMDLRRTIRRIHIRHDRDFAKIDCTIAALAIESYRLKHSTPPGQLRDLVPQFIDAVPVDTFDGMPLRYETTDNSYVVYSIGDDNRSQHLPITNPDGSPVHEIQIYVARPGSAQRAFRLHLRKP